MNGELRFLRACAGEPVDRMPVWMMRQAGRYLPEYRKLREKHPFLEMCKTPELAVEVTLQPVDRFGMDAGILFSDILLLLEAMGAELHFDDNQGPRVRCDEFMSGNVQALRIPDPAEDLGFVFEAIRLLRGALKGRAALIGFSGAPFTLASYLIEGGSSSDFHATKTFMYRNPISFHRLMDILSDAVEVFLLGQIEAGVQAVQLFDTWAGLLSPNDYREYVLPYTRRIFERLPPHGPATLHFSLGTSTLLNEMAQTGAGVLSLDWKIDIGDARQRLGPAQPVQGNMDPLALFQPDDRLDATVLDILRKGSLMPGYIFNLGHGVHQKTPLESVYRMVDTVRSFPVARSGERE